MQKKNRIILHIMHSEIGGAGDIALNLNQFENRFLQTEYLMTGPRLFYGFKKKFKSIKKNFFFQRIDKRSHLLKIMTVIKK